MEAVVIFDTTQTSFNNSNCTLSLKKFSDGLDGDNTGWTLTHRADGMYLLSVPETLPCFYTVTETAAPNAKAYGTVEPLDAQGIRDAMSLALTPALEHGAPESLDAKIDTAVLTSGYANDASQAANAAMVSLSKAVTFLFGQLLITPSGCDLSELDNWDVTADRALADGAIIGACMFNYPGPWAPLNWSGEMFNLAYGINGNVLTRQTEFVDPEPIEGPLRTYPTNAQGRAFCFCVTGPIEAGTTVTVHVHGGNVGTYPRDFVFTFPAYTGADDYFIPDITGTCRLLGLGNEMDSSMFGGAGGTGATVEEVQTIHDRSSLSQYVSGNNSGGVMVYPRWDPALWAADTGLCMTVMPGTLAIANGVRTLTAHPDDYLFTLTGGTTQLDEVFDANASCIGTGNVLMARIPAAARASGGYSPGSRLSFVWGSKRFIIDVPPVSSAAAGDVDYVLGVDGRWSEFINNDLRVLDGLTRDELIQRTADLSNGDVRYSDNSNATALLLTNNTAIKRLVNKHRYMNIYDCYPPISATFSGTFYGTGAIEIHCFTVSNEGITDIVHLGTLAAGGFAPAVGAPVNISGLLMLGFSGDQTLACTDGSLKINMSSPSVPFATVSVVLKDPCLASGQPRYITTDGVHVTQYEDALSMSPLPPTPLEIAEEVRDVPNLLPLTNSIGAQVLASSIVGSSLFRYVRNLLLRKN